MDVLFLLACDPDAQRGNATTAKRLAKGLARHNIKCHLVASKSAQDAISKLPKQDAIVAFHAEKSGPQAQALAKELGIPYVVLFTGTDLGGRPRKEGVRAVEQAEVAVTLGQSAAKRAVDYYPACEKKLVVIPQGALESKERSPLPDHLPSLPEGKSSLIVVPANIRPVKAQVRILKALQSLAERRPEIRVWFAGPSLDKDYEAEFLQAIDAAPWADWIGEIPYTAMPALYRKADIVLSASRAEGGPPNALLEAALAGTPVAASHIPAHKELGLAARLFSDDAGMRRQLSIWLDDPARGARQGRDMREWARTAFQPAQEHRAWADLLNSLSR